MFPIFPSRPCPKNTQKLVSGYKKATFHSGFPDNFLYPTFYTAFFASESASDTKSEVVMPAPPSAVLTTVCIRYVGETRTFFCFLRHLWLFPLFLCSLGWEGAKNGGKNSSSCLSLESFLLAYSTDEKVLLLLLRAHPDYVIQSINAWKPSSCFHREHRRLGVCKLFLFLLFLFLFLLFFWRHFKKPVSI